MGRPIIEVEHLTKKYRLGVVGATTLSEDITRLWHRLRGETTVEKGEFWALRDVSFKVEPGEVVGIVGRNGAGKSTLLKILSRITEPTSGRAVLRGRVASLLEVGTGFHPDLTGRENVFLNGAILGMKQTEISGRFDDIVGFSEVEKFIDTPVKHYSSGMRVRLAFAVAAFLESEILIVDEVLAVGDLAFQQRCIRHVRELASHSHRAVILVSHQLPVMQSLADSALLLENGRLVAQGKTAEVLEQHTKTQVTSRTEMDWPRETAPGDERCRLTGLRLVPALPPSGTDYSCVHPPVVEMDVLIGEPTRDLCIGFDLVHEREGAVLRTYHADRTTAPALAPGNHRLRCALPAGTLKTGRYEVQPRIGVHNVAWIVSQTEPLVFNLLQDQPGASPIWWQNSARPGAIAPLLTWDRT